MSDDKPKKSWNAVAKEGDDRLGFSKDMLKKLLEVNPNLKGNQRTDDVLKDVKSQLKQAPGAAKTADKKHSVVFGSDEKPPDASQKDAATIGRIGDTKRELARRLAKLDDEIKKLQAARSEELLKAKQALVALAHADASFATKAVQEALERERAWLETLGLKPSDLIKR